VITDRECTNCGRCIDVCGPDVFTIHPPLRFEEGLTMQVHTFLKLTLAAGLFVLGTQLAGRRRTGQAAGLRGGTPAAGRASAPGAKSAVKALRDTSALRQGQPAAASHKAGTRPRADGRATSCSSRR
jgi:ferredoxin